MLDEINTDKNKILFFSGMAGLLAPLLSFIMIYLALNKSYSWFHWRYNWLSDLGVHARSDTYFNSGLILSGALMILFSIGIHYYLKEKTIFTLGKAALLIGSISLVMIGIFPEDIVPAHQIATILFFSFLTFSVMILGIGHILKRDMIGIVLVASSVMSILMWAIFWPGAHRYVWAGAIPEATSVFFLSLSIIWLSYRMMAASV